MKSYLDTMQSFFPRHYAVLSDAMQSLLLVFPDAIQSLKLLSCSYVVPPFSWVDTSLDIFVYLYQSVVL